jgi:hypothetical protein
MRLRSYGFQSTNRGNRFGVDFGPPLRGRQTHTEPRERAWTSGDGKEIHFVERERKLRKEKIKLPEHSRRENFLRPCGNDADYFLILKDGDAARRRRCIQGKNEHGSDYRAIRVPNSPRNERF